MPVITVLAFVGFTGAVAVTSYLLVRGTNSKEGDGYFLGGRSLTGPVIAGSLLLTNLSTEQIVGLNGQAFEAGVAVMAWETTSAIALVFTAMYLLPRYLKGGIRTISEFVGDRFDDSTRSIVAAMFLAGYVLIFLPTVLYSGSLALSSIFDIPNVVGVSETVALWITVWAIGIIGSLYAIGGGLKAVAVSDSINAVGLFLGGLLVPIFGLVTVGDGNLFDGISTLMSENPAKFDATGGPDSLLPFSVIFTGLALNQLFYWGTNQAIVQRAFAAKDLKAGQRGLMLAAFGKVFVPIIVVLPGIIAFHIFGDQVGNNDDAYPMLVAEVLPRWLSGFFAAVLFGAILSSFNSVLNSATTLFGVDIYKTFFNADATDEDSVRAGRRMGIVVALMAMIVAPFIANAPDGLFALLQELNGAYSIPILSVVLIGYMTTRVPAIAAKVALLGGTTMYLLSQFVVAPRVGDAYPHFLHVQFVVFVVIVGIMLVASRLQPRDTEYELADSGAVELNRWNHVKVAGAAASVLVVSTFVFFTG